jgi:hypothetical protein
MENPHLSLELEAIPGATAPSTINLVRGNIAIEHLRLIAGAIPKARFPLTIELDYNDFDDEGIECLAKAIAVTPVKITLSLVGSNLSYQQVNCLAEALKVAPCEIILNLSLNELGDQVASSLAEAIKVAISPLTLILCSNIIGPIGAEHLAKALKVATVHVTLDLKFNRIATEGAMRLREAIKAAVAPINVNVGANGLAYPERWAFDEDMSDNFAIGAGTDLEGFFKKIEVIPFSHQKLRVLGVNLGNMLYPLIDIISGYLGTLSELASVNIQMIQAFGGSVDNKYSSINYELLRKNLQIMDLVRSGVSLEVQGLYRLALNSFNAAMELANILSLEDQALIKARILVLETVVAEHEFGNDLLSTLQPLGADVGFSRYGALAASRLASSEIYTEMFLPNVGLNSLAYEFLGLVSQIPSAFVKLLSVKHISFGVLGLSALIGHMLYSGNSGDGIIVPEGYVDVPGDGHCFYHAMVQQIPGLEAGEVHQMAVNEILAHPERYNGFGDINQLMDYQLRRVDGEDGAWADHVMIQAAVNAVGRPVHIEIFNLYGARANDDAPIIIIEPVVAVDGLEPILLGNIGNIHFVAHE